MSILRFLMILSLAVWIGGLMFFAVTAQTAFSVLPSRHLAGSVVASALGKLHWMALISAIVYLATSIVYSRLSRMKANTSTGNSNTRNPIMVPPL